MSGGGATTNPSRSPGARILASVPDVDHVAVRIVAGERKHRPAVVVKLLVVVVLDDRDALAARQIEQLEPARRRQHHRRRVLVVRRDVDQPHRLAARQRRQRAHVDAVIVDGDRHDLGPARRNTLKAGA